MLGSLEYRSLYRSSVVSIDDVSCRPVGCDCGPEECAGEHLIVFPRAGAFVRHVNGRDVLADANHVLFFNSDESYRVSHPVPGGDDCTTFSFAPGVLRDAVARHDAAVRDRPTRMFPLTHGLSDRRSFVLQQALRRCVCGPPCRDISVDELALDLLDSVVGSALRAPRRRTPGSRPATWRAHAEMAHAARTVLAQRYHEPLCLGDVAEAVYCSPYHLARLFRRNVGMPIHRYLTRLRLREAVQRLADGNPSLTDLALDLGFSSHSHFTDTFRREFGATPSAFRDRLTATRLRQMSKNLEVCTGRLC